MKCLKPKLNHGKDYCLTKKSVVIVFIHKNFDFTTKTFLKKSKIIVIKTTSNVNFEIKTYQ